MRKKWVIKLLSVMLSLTVILPLSACDNTKKSSDKAAVNDKYNEQNGLADDSNNGEITDDDIKGITKDQMNNFVEQYKIFANNAMKASNYLMEDPVKNKDNCEKVLSDMTNEKEELLKVVPDCLKDDLSNYMDKFVKLSQDSLNNGKYNHEDYDECDNDRYNFEIKAKVVLDKLHMDTNFY